MAEESNKFGSDGIDPNEIAAMMGMATETKEEEKEIVEESTVKEPETEVVEEVEEPEVEAEAEEVETEEEISPEDRYSALLETFNKQSLELLELKARGPYQSKDVEKEEVVETTTKPPVPLENVTIDKEKLRQAFIDGDDEAVGSLLTGFAGSVAQYVEGRIEGFLKGAPRMMQSIANETLAFAEAKNKFYKENPDLLPYTPIVGTVSLQVFSQNPGKPLHELMGEVEKETRKVLGLKKSIAGNTTKSPAFVRGKSKRSPVKEALGGMKGEIAEMLKARQQY